MDHAQLTSADYAQINANNARKEARDLSLKIDGLASILGYTPDDLLQKGKEIREEQERKKKEQEAINRKKEEDEFQASGLSRGEWNSKKMMDMNLKSMCAGFDITESLNFALGATGEPRR